MDDDEERFTALFKCHYPDVLRYAARRSDPDRARDVAAETFLVAWRRLNEVPRDADQVLPWLYSVARNTLANQHRGERRRLRLGARLGAAVPRRTGADHAGTVVESLRLREALHGLSAADQETLRLVGWEGLDVAAAAAAAGCTPQTFAVRLHRARQRLDRALADQDTGRARSRRTLAAKEAES
ncbi:sigma-70 family RNA polymerase sigma factor [Actinomadura fulvescens]|uniref:RNA polymerase sigma factor n=1 Tax=Actinomadura fulvescens TaxID=46160 RepID=UPI0031E300E8